MAKIAFVVLYLTGWAAIAVSIGFGLLRAGLSPWIAVSGAWLLVMLLFGSLSYVLRARRLVAEGKPSPGYFRSIFGLGLSQSELQARIRIPRPVRVALGGVVLITSLIFLAGAGLLLARIGVNEAPRPLGAIVFAIVMAIAGAAFGYIAVRLFVVRDNESLFPSKAVDVGSRIAP